MAGLRGSPFNTDKPALLRRVLDRYDCAYRETREGNQKVRCIDQRTHPNGDRNPSASIKLGEGLYHCFACGLSGDGYDLMMELEGMRVAQVNQMLEPGAVKEEPEWII